MMKLKILIVFLLWTSIHAETHIQKNKELYYAQQGMAYIKRKAKQKSEHIKLKKYFLAKTREKPFFFSSNDVVYNLYLTAFLQRAHPVWLENDQFVFHTSSNKRYLKRLQKRYKRKYHLDLTLHKNPYFWKEKFTLRKVDTEDLVKYIDAKTSAYTALKMKKKRKKKKKLKDTTIRIAKIHTKRELWLVKKASKSLEKHHQVQEKQRSEGIKLKKYFLAKTRKKPFFFSSNDVVYNLYLTAFLQKGHPVWLENDQFVFHTSSNKRYLKRLQKRYKRKYHLDLTLYKNPYFRKKKFTLRNVDTENLVQYMNDKIAAYTALKTKKQRKKKIQKKKIRSKNTRVHVAKIVTKKEVWLVKKYSQYLQKHKRETALNRYILYKKVKYPLFFSSHKPIYNLYVTAILQRGEPKWLENTTFIFHTSSSKNYLKKLQKVYKKKSNLDLKIFKNTKDKKTKFRLMSIDNEKILAYIQAQMPQKYKRKLKSTKKVRKIEKKEIIKAGITKDRDIYYAQQGRAYIRGQAKQKREHIKLKKYFLAKTREKPFFFSSNDVVYNLYLTAFLQKARPVWLENDQFVFHTSSSKRYLKRLKKYYERKYHLYLTLYKNPSFWKKKFTLRKVDTEDLVQYVNDKTSEYMRLKEKRWLK